MPPSEKELSAAKSTRLPKGWTYKAASVAIAFATVGVLGAVGAGCLTRPVTSQNPTTKTNFSHVSRRMSGLIAASIPACRQAA